MSAAIYMDASTSFTTISDYTVVGEMRVGANGDAYGSPEYDVGASADDATLGRTTWDTDLSDGFDTTARAITFSAGAGGGSDGVSLGVQDASDGDLAYGGTTYGAVDHVVLRVAAQGSDTEAQWTDLAVKFYRGGVLVETVPVSTTLCANTFNSSTGAAEVTCTVVPSDSNDDAIVITGNVRLRCTDADVQPGANDALAQVFLFANDASPA